jgi:membrane-bound serine protease (ClpP class)
LTVSIPIGVITAFLVSIALRARRGKVQSGVEGLVGVAGIARTPLVPNGKITVQGEIWNAVSSTDVPEGEPVIIRSVEGLTLRVEPVRIGDTQQLSAKR